MAKYRIKSKEIIEDTSCGKECKTYYYIQCKILGFWITITTAFTTLKQAEEHITLKLKERQVDGN